MFLITTADAKWKKGQIMTSMRELHMKFLNSFLIHKRTIKKRLLFIIYLFRIKTLSTELMKPSGNYGPR